MEVIARFIKEGRTLKDLYAYAGFNIKEIK